MNENIVLKRRIVGFLGSSGSGKTTLIEKILPLLNLMGLRVSVVKSSHHDVELEPPRKDSARFRKAGATEVMLVSPYRYMLAQELDGKQLPELDAMLQRMQHVDLVIVEGYKQAKLERLEVYRPALGKAPMYLEDETIRAVASDSPKPSDLPNGIVWLDLNEESQIVDWILGRN